jgi:esterase/lipase superfamily enzyme
MQNKPRKSDRIGFLSVKNRSFCILLFVGILFQACAPPKIVKFAKKDRSINNPSYYEVKVVYGTDRKPTGEKTYPKWYGASRNYEGSQLQYGTVTVSIPKEHKVGEIEKPNFWNIYDRENPSKYIVLTGLDTMKTTAITNLRAMVNRSRDKDAFIFVHGYNNTFEDAAKRTAQLAFDIGFRGCPAMFSWPSNGKPRQYVSDSENSDWAIPHLRSFILKVIEESKPEKLHVIAHSMGNKVLLNVLRTLQAENPDVQFNQIILAAPDVDVAIFKDQIAPKITQMAKRITLYCSANDKALMMARKLRSNYVRVGESHDPLYTGIETIDATSITDKLFDLNHSYINQSSPIINDVFLLFKSNASPQERNLVSMPVASGVYWVFR